MDLGTTVTLVLVCILVEAFFSGCEIGMISINRFKMEQRVKEGSTSARMILDLISNPDRLFATTSMGTNVAVVSSSAVFTGYMITHFGEWGDIFSLLIISPVILFGGEIIPKVIFQNRADSIMQFFIHPLNLFCRVLSPIITLFSAVYNLFLRLILRGAHKVNLTPISREQIRYISHPDFLSSELDMEEKKMIHRIFNFGEIRVEQVMVPLIQTYAISDAATVQEANQIANETGFSRLPVFHERMFNLIGILNTFDLLTVPPDDSPITHMIRPAYYVPPNKKLDDLLKELQQRGLHIAIVVDEYGGCIGMITLEDMLEEIVGEIEDEHDEPHKKYEVYDGGGYLIDGDKEIGAVNEELALDLPEGEYETMAGLMIEKLEKIPVAGDQVTLNGFRLTVKEASKRKINSIILRKIASEYPPKPSAQSSTDEKNLEAPS
ncbi:MAG: HlyC/CorC family transporter [Nitrospinae bacterium]|nr:HlyC/CorC family transporter [Nitrospinota bacterium]MCH8932037.1 HlyC/CorC family transporter [Nitrospinota bacterium]